MNINTFEGKTLEDALNTASSELVIGQTEYIYQKEEIKGGLFKSGGVRIKVVLLNEICNFIKEELLKIFKEMNLDVTFETKIRDNKITIKMYSDNNAVLIGKGGKTLSALQTILSQMIFNKIKMYPYFVLDVENYKEKQELNLEKLASRIAKEVASTKIDATLENMNSYERRIVHNYLSNLKNIYTISEGEEPERHIVIKYKED